MIANLIARGLDLHAEVTVRALDLVADTLAWLSDVSGEGAETVRWWATAARQVP